MNEVPENMSFSNPQVVRGNLGVYYSAEDRNFTKLETQTEKGGEATGANVAPKQLETLAFAPTTDKQGLLLGLIAIGVFWLILRQTQ